MIKLYYNKSAYPKSVPLFEIKEENFGNAYFDNKEKEWVHFKWNYRERTDKLVTILEYS